MLIYQQGLYLAWLLGRLLFGLTLRLRRTLLGLILRALLILIAASLGFIHLA